MRRSRAICIQVCLLALLVLVLIGNAPAQDGADSELVSGTMFDWSIAKQDERLTTAATFVGGYFILSTQRDFDNFRKAVETMVACMNYQMSKPGDAPIASVAEECVMMLKAAGVL